MPVGPRLIVLTFKKTTEVPFGKFTGAGFKQGETLAGSPCFVMPSPFATTYAVHAHLQELREWVRNTRRDRPTTSET